MTSTSNGNSYGYDANGNQTTRTVGGQTYTLSYDAENRLVSVSGAVSATFVYDGDGNRVKTVVGSTTTTYIGNYLEWTGSTTTMKKYYYAGGQRIAMRQGSSTLYFLLTDHLGSTAITATSGGERDAELRYYPWGGTRFTYGTTPTSYRYTGQREAEVGLYYYGARFYDHQLGRFMQADSIITNPGDPIAFDRYSYVRNSPIRYVDPSGHNYCDSDNALAEDCQGITDLLPDKECRADISCYDAYLAYYWLVLLLGSKPSDLDLLHMTIETEYWAYTDKSSVAVIAQEGLARNYYARCGTDGCQGSEIYQFLKGYAPWIGRASIIDGTAATRAGHLLNAWSSGANSAVTNHATTILNAKNPDPSNRNLSWTSGYDPNRPWQWYGPFEWDPSNKPDTGYLSTDDAILAVDLGNNRGFWLFTGAQTEHFNKDAWGPLEAKPQ